MEPLSTEIPDRTAAAEIRAAAGRGFVPVAVSAGLVAWLACKVSLPDLLKAAASLPWPAMLAATAAMVLALYAWDGLCLPVAYGIDRSPLTYFYSLRARGMAYLIGAFNAQLGEAMVAWNVARIQHTSFLAMFSRSVVQAYHDALILSVMGLIGSSLSDAPRACQTRILCAALLLLLIAVGIVAVMLPKPLRLRFQAARIGAWLETWSWRRSLRLLLLRTVYLSILGLYAAVAFRICGLTVAPRDVLSTVPIVLLVVTLPSVSGYGTREFALYELLGPNHRDVILAMSLFWSTGMMCGRLLIGLVCLWLRRQSSRHRAQ